MDKKALRSDLSAKRAQVHGVVDTAPALAALLAAIGDRRGAVSFYWPIRTEIDPRAAMEALADRQVVCLPVTQGYAPLSFRAWRPRVAMETDGFGVSVPSETDAVTPQVLVIPMLGFDDAGNRLGYGAGHYDRTLERLRVHGPVTAIGFAYEAQRVDTLPTEPTDQPLDMIVTEAKTRHVMR